MADEKIIQNIGFQQAINLGDNYTIPAGTTVNAGGGSKGFSRMQQIHEMKKQAAAEGLTLAQYMAKLKAEMEEAERAMQDVDKPNTYTEVEVLDETPVAAPSGGSVTSEEDKKRKALELSNTIFMKVCNDKKIDLLAVYRFIEKEFIPWCQHKYAWTAVLVFFRKFLTTEEYEAFSSQMMNPSWFGAYSKDRNKGCSADSIGEYSFIVLEKDHDKWNVNLKQGASRASSKGVAHISMCYMSMLDAKKNYNFYIQETDSHK